MGASIKTMLELWASSLRDVKVRMRAEAARDPGPWLRHNSLIVGIGRKASRERGELDLADRRIPSPATADRREPNSAANDPLSVYPNTGEMYGTV